MLRIQKIYESLVMIFAVFFVIGMSTANSFSQVKPKIEKPKTIEIPVKKDAKQNGYKLFVDANLFYYQIVNIVEPEDPLKIVNGKVKMKYRCEKHKKMEKTDESDKIMDIILENGGTKKTKSPCTNQLQPYMQINFIIALKGTFPPRN